MKAIVFGAGKIARGFIGQLLYLSKADITFVDIDQQLVDRLNKDQKYHVYILGRQRWRNRRKRCLISLSV